MEYTSVDVMAPPEENLKPKVEKVANDDNKAVTQESESESKPELDSARKWKYTLITTVIFIIVVHPYTYIFVNYLANKLFSCKFMIASASGCPTTIGLIVHTVVFTLLLRYVMDLKL
jgi:hypothetical protein